MKEALDRYFKIADEMVELELRKADLQRERFDLCVEIEKELGSHLLRYKNNTYCLVTRGKSKYFVPLKARENSKIKEVK